MFNKFQFFKKEQILNQDKNNIELFRKHAVEIYDELCKDKLAHLKIDEYIYDTSIAVDELGLDEDLVNQLVDDYVAQIIKATIVFDDYMEVLQDSKNKKVTLDYTPFRELAHKNLGVARNLRIRDAEKLLYELMKKNDLEYLFLCLEALKVSAIKLRPQCAYDTLKLIEVKNFLS